MKYLLILLFPLTAFSWSLTEISNMSLFCNSDDCIPTYGIVLSRLVDSGDPENQCLWSMISLTQSYSALRPFDCDDIWLTCDADPECDRPVPLPLCENEVRPACAVPLEVTMQSEHTDYVIIVTQIENDRLYVEAKKIEIRDLYLNSLRAYKHQIVSKLGLSIPNPDAHVRDKIKSIDTVVKADSVLATFTNWASKIAAIVAEQDAEQALVDDCKTKRIQLRDFDPESVVAGNAVNILKQLTRLLKCYERKTQ